MDSESNTYGVGNDPEGNPPDMNDSVSNKSSETQSNFLEVVHVVEDVNNPSTSCENVMKDVSLVSEHSDNIVCETSQSKQTHKFMKFPLQDNYQGINTNTDECDKNNEMLEETLFPTVNPVDASEATTSQDNSPSSSHDKESNILHADQNKVKRGTLMENLGDDLDEDTTKRQKLNDNAHEEENLIDDIVTFQKTNSKARQRNYRKRRNATSDNEDNSRATVHNEAVREASILDADEGLLSNDISYDRRFSLKHIFIMSFNNILKTMLVF